MKTYTKTETTEQPRLVIEHDEFSQSPRDWDNLGYFITCQRRYNSPDNDAELVAMVKRTGEEARNVAEHQQMITDYFKNERREKVAAIYPVYMYEHSSVAYRLGSASGFDISNCGFYIVTEKSAKKLGVIPTNFEKAIKSELSEYTSWANGEVYQYQLFDEQGEEISSCGGFYSLEDIREDLPSEWKDEKLSEYMKY